MFQGIPIFFEIQKMPFDLTTGSEDTFENSPVFQDDLRIVHGKARRRIIAMQNKSQIKSIGIDLGKTTFHLVALDNPNKRATAL